MVERTLNQRQVEVLGWIGGGCPDGVMEGFTYKTTAQALHGRRLVEVTKQRGYWKAEITHAGTYFLEHGAYPEGHWSTYGRPPRQAPVPTRPEQPHRVTALRPTDQLLADVASAGGQLTVPRESGRYGNLVSSAIRAGKVPEGKILTIDQGGKWEEQIVRLVDKPAWMTVVLEPIQVAGALRKPHPAIAILRARDLPLRPAVQSRSLRLLDALAKEAVRRGYTVEASDRRNGGRRERGLLKFTIVGHSMQLDLDELKDSIPHIPTTAEVRDAERHAWKRIPTHDQVPSGRLRIRVLDGFSVRQDAFRDTKRIDLADRLPQILQELELRAHDAEQRRIERERHEAEHRTNWECAVEQAKEAAREDARTKVLLDHASRWERCILLDQYLAALQTVVNELEDGARADAESWLAWARDFRARLDPLSERIAMPPDPDYNPQSLGPYMPSGFSSYGP